MRIPRLSIGTAAVGVAAICTASAALAISCEELQSSVEAKVRSNGVKSFSIAIVEANTPASGQVVGLKVFTIGGVIPPGETLMEIVPERVKLVVQTQIAPTDADDIYVGQEAEIRISALHNRQLPILTGKVTRLSADSFLDERTGQRFFTAEVNADPVVLKKFSELVGGGRIKAGLPVEVILPTRKRTLFQYLMEPLDQSLWSTFREQ